MSELVRYRLSEDDDVHVIPLDELTPIKNVKWSLPGQLPVFDGRDELYAMPDGMHLLLHVRPWNDTAKAVVENISKVSDAEILTPHKAASWLCEREFDEEAKALRAKLPERKNANESEHETCHSDDFASVRWYNKPFTFTATQAACVKVLWEHWEQGTPTVGQSTILEAAESPQRYLTQVFRKTRAGKKSMHPAWGTMIVKVTEAGVVCKGLYRLQEPAE